MYDVFDSGVDGIGPDFDRARPLLPFLTSEASVALPSWIRARSILRALCIGDLNFSSDDLRTFAEEVQRTDKRWESIRAAGLRVQIDELPNFASVPADAWRRKCLTNMGVKHSLCLISILSKIQPSESMPTKNGFVA